MGMNKIKSIKYLSDIKIVSGIQCMAHTNLLENKILTTRLFFPSSFNRKSNIAIYKCLTRNKRFLIAAEHSSSLTFKVNVISTEETISASSIMKRIKKSVGRDQRSAYAIPHGRPAREKTINVTSPTFLRSSKYYITQSTFRGGNDSTITTLFRQLTLMQIIQHRSKSRIRILF
jgi:hypothetical protein